MIINQQQLSNGLRLITIPQKERSVAAVLVLVGAGSKYENKNISGVSHILEHLMFKGTEKRPTPLDVVETLDGVGGSYNAFTGQEYTGYYAKVDSQHLELAADWVSDIFLNAALRKEDLNRERPVIIEELNMYLDSPQEYVGELWEKVLYGDQPAGWPIIGRQETINGISREQVVDYFNHHYSGRNTVIVVAGDLHPDLDTLIKDKFSNISTEQAPGKKPVGVDQQQPQLLVRHQDTDQTHICVGGRGFSLSDQEKYAQAVLASALGGNMSSRLFNLIREKHSLAYYIHTSSHVTTDSGCIVTQAGIANDKVREALSLILEEYHKVAEQGLKSGELDKVKEYLEGNLMLSLDSCDSLAFHFGKEELLTENILTPEELSKKIDAVTAEQVQEVARQVFQNKNLNLAVIGPFQEEDLQDQLTF